MDVATEEKFTFLHPLASQETWDIIIIIILEIGITKRQVQLICLTPFFPLDCHYDQEITRKVIKIWQQQTIRVKIVGSLLCPVLLIDGDSESLNWERRMK